ncbi:MAG: metallophosphoesterase [Deltaproteobacteria bacterium]|nr:metallophosphoesterase [Deltaproteobacteria bacterium]
MADLLETNLIHISDLHLHIIPTRISHFRGKRVLGAVNLLLRRRRAYPRARALGLVRLLDEMKWDHLVITGDLTQLGLEEEFDLARQVLAPLLERGPGRVTILPGNHDRYDWPFLTRDWFSMYFGEFFQGGEITTRELTPHWHLAGWDSTRLTHPIMADGLVRPETLKATGCWITELPQGSRVMVANHFPLAFPPPRHSRWHHDLRNIPQVLDWMADQPVDVYLHGHMHHNWVVEQTLGGRPVRFVNSASSTQVLPPGEPSSFHRVVLAGREARVIPHLLG